MKLPKSVPILSGSPLQVEGLVDLLQKEPGPFKSPPLSPPDGNFVQISKRLLLRFEKGLNSLLCRLLNIFWKSWSCQLVIALKLVSRRMLKSETGQICKSFLSHSQYFSVFVGIHIQKESLVKLGLIPSAKHSFPSGRLKSANPLAGGVLNNKQRRKIINRN